MASKESIFKTKYQEREHFYAPTGEPIEYKHEATFDEKTGRRVLTKTRLVNTYEMIQVGREETEIARIVQRARNGDTSVLNAMNGQYIDVTDMPKNLAEAQQFMINAENMFEKMPNEVKAKFGYDSDRFIHEAGTDVTGWLDKMGLQVDMETGKTIEKKIVADLEDLTSGTGAEITRQEVEANGNA